MVVVVVVARFGGAGESCGTRVGCVACDGDVVAFACEARGRAREVRCVVVVFACARAEVAKPKEVGAAEIKSVANVAIIFVEIIFVEIIFVEIVLRALTASHLIAPAPKVFAGDAHAESSVRERVARC
jgi:hypothetical protein